MALAGALGAARLSTTIEPQNYIRDVRYLSSSGLEGRGSGTPGLDKAAAYIARQFERAGVRPVSGHSYAQPLPISLRSSLGEKNKLSYRLQDVDTPVAADEFLPFNFSGAGEVTAGVVFAGFGVTAPEYNYDDYAGLDLRGKIVLILRHEPQEFDSASSFEGRIYTEHSQWFSKASNARAHGALAVLVTTDIANHSSDTFEPFSQLVGPADPGIPVIQIKAAVVEKWLALNHESLKNVQEDIDRELKPHSFALPASLQISLSVHVQHVTREVANVFGYLPGETPEYVIIGAHYDHLGRGEQYSMAPAMAGTVHPGADDNASGTAGVLALARWFSSQPKMKRGVLFAAFAGEEIGLLGSSHYVRHPLLPLDHARLMINMDMIGRIRERKVMVTGATPGTPIRKTLEQLGSKYGLELQLDDGGVYGSSDHTSFRTKAVPILFFFSGLHPDYHKPTDTWEKIDAHDASTLLQLIADFVAHLQVPEPPSSALNPSAFLNHSRISKF